MNLRKDHYRIRSLFIESSLKKPRALLPRVFGSSALDFDVRWVRSGRQVCLNSPWTASWRVLLKLKALRPFQEVKLLLSREELCNRRLNFGRLWSTTF